MKRVLITGGNGFVGRHLVRYLHKEHREVEIMLLARSEPLEPDGVVCFRVADLCERKHLRRVLNELQPDGVIHLASESSVAVSWQDPHRVLENNIRGFINLVESVREISHHCRLLVVGSSEQYGVTNRNPVSEQAPQFPCNPYGVSKCAQEQIARMYAQSFAMDIVMTRSFNHIGSGQSENFAVASFAKQIIRRKQLGPDSPVRVGNLKTVRDLVDVRDVVKAYWGLLKSGTTGEVFNVCSGCGYSLQGVLELMMELAGLEAQWQVDPACFRPNDVPALIGDGSRIRGILGWVPNYTLRESLQPVLDEWQQRTESTQQVAHASLL
ncbi:MAG: GDP-mannose 4,6-dehydratase [Puniceicoccaceae bacterium]